MNYYRCVKKSGGSGDFSASYTGTINGVVQRGTAVSRFEDDRSFNQSIIVGANIANCYAMLQNCTNFGANIYFKRTEYYLDGWKLNICNMLRGTNNQKQKNIFFHSILNNIFNNTYDIVAAPITWYWMTNGFYNTTYNIYCYNNYNG